ncbi:MAG: PilZ domain-containing protein [Spirochaetaceae bacterium]|jgi:hypothetical protein|nr:PilZ domain-containing protein [Spirochaetaceae bacterium]
MTVDNKRMGIRRNLIIYLDCIDLASGLEIGKVIDITQEGCMILTESPQDINSSLCFKVELPEADVFKDKELIVKGICCWVKKEKLQDIYCMGISFTEQTEEFHSIILNLISKIGFSDGQRKICTTEGDIKFK